jgi:hypothetical protein
MEINGGLGTSPTVESTGSSNSGTATTGGSVSAGDLCIASGYSSAQATAPAGWHELQNGSNAVSAWEFAPGGGTVTAAFQRTSGITGASLSCFKPTPMSSICTISILGAGPC